jgi:hypothetical protein
MAVSAVRANVGSVLLAMAGALVGLLGNVLCNLNYLRYFALYFLVCLGIIFFMLYVCGCVGILCRARPA